MDDFSCKEIKEQIDKVLREIGALEPPINLEDVLSHLNLHKEYYDLSNPTLIQEISHKLKVGAFKIRDVITKIDLRGIVNAPS